MPSARYTFGFTVFPDWPTWRALGIQPASTIGRETERVAPIASASSWNWSRFSFSPMPRPTESRKSAVVMSTSPATTSTQSLCRAREVTGVDARLGHARRAGALGRRPGGRAEEEQHLLVTRELDLAVHLRAVEGPLGDELAAVVADAEHVRGEAEPELRGQRGRVAHRVDGEAEQDHAGAPLAHERLDRVLVDVVLELLLLDGDGDDLVDPLDVDGVRERGRVARDDGDGDRAAERLRGADELQGHRAKLAPDVLGDDEDAHAVLSSTISLIRAAISPGSPSSISAPSPFGGTNIRRTRAAGVPRSPGSRTSISFSSACLIARRVA